MEAFLGDFEGVLSSGGYEAYARYVAKRAGVRHAQCWAHARGGFELSRDGEPETAGAALSLIGALYPNDKAIRARKLKGAANYLVPPISPEHQHMAPARHRRGIAGPSTPSSGVDVRSVPQPRKGNRREDLLHDICKKLATVK